MSTCWRRRSSRGSAHGWIARSRCSATAWARCFDEFESRYLREYANFYQFLLAIYDMNVDEHSYFWAARKVLHSEERSNEAFVQLVGGVSGHDPVYHHAEDYLDAREHLGEALQRLSEGRGETIGELPFDRARLDPGQFLKDFLSEGTQLQTLARLRARRPRESPLFEHGLVPSADGLRWCEAELAVSGRAAAAKP